MNIEYIRIQLQAMNDDTLIHIIYSEINELYINVSFTYR